MITIVIQLLKLVPVLSSPNTTPALLSPAVSQQPLQGSPMTVSMPSQPSTLGAPTVVMGTATPTPTLTPMEVNCIITVWGQGIVLTDPTEHLLHAHLLIVDWLVICSMMGGWQCGVP